MPRFLTVVMVTIMLFASAAFASSASPPAAGHDDSAATVATIHASALVKGDQHPIGTISVTVDGAMGSLTFMLPDESRFKVRLQVVSLEKAPYGIRVAVGQEVWPTADQLSPPHPVAAGSAVQVPLPGGAGSLELALESVAPAEGTRR